MIKNIFVISDIELGQGDLFDDFRDEHILVDFINKITGIKGKNILILNGDTFDFLKMQYQGAFTTMSPRKFPYPRSTKLSKPIHAFSRHSRAF